MTPEDKAIRRAARKVVEWTVERDRLIRERVEHGEEGSSLRAVGEVAEMSHQAIKYIATGRPSRANEGTKK